MKHFLAKNLLFPYVTGREIINTTEHFSNPSQKVDFDSTLAANTIKGGAKVRGTVRDEVRGTISAN